MKNKKNKCDGQVLFIILDGVGDRPHEALEWKTPLEAANIPTLDILAQEGTTGIADIVAPGIPVGTDVGHLVIFGINPFKEYPGRGPIEAMGVGIKMKPDDIAFRCNFATKKDGIIIDRRAGRIRDDAKLIAENIDGILPLPDVKTRFIASTEHRAVLLLSGKHLSHKVTATDPGPYHIPCMPLEAKARKIGDIKAEKTALALNRFVQKAENILSHHPVNKKREMEGKLPANTILIRGGGKISNVKSIFVKDGIKGCCIAGEKTIIGIARLVGLDTISAPTFTANHDTNLNLKLETAVEAIKKYDFVYLHIKAPDILGHDKKPIDKMRFLEKLDFLLSKYLDNLKSVNNLYIAIGADHATLSNRGEHSGDPVPILLWGKDVIRDKSMGYYEKECAHGGLGRIKMKDFVNIIFDHTCWQERFEHALD